MISLKEIYIERQDRLLRIAVKENSKLLECFVEEENCEPVAGEIYKGIVKNIIPAIKCAFLDIGHKKNVYMYLDSKFNNTKVKKGDELLVQVVKEDTENKGAKVTNALSLPGRYSVLQTLSRELVFSKKIESDEYKAAMAREIKRPKDIGLMIRTNAVNVGVETINKEVENLYSEYRELVKKAEFTANIGLIFNDGGILGKVLRDKIDSETAKMYVNSKEDLQFVNKFIQNNSDVAPEIVFYEGERTIFDYFGIEREILNLRHERVNLPCGGYIVIDRTEAMYVIDVNSGKNVKGSSIEKTAYLTNVQAASEIARQIILRNLSGIIVVDFIDMDKREYKKEILSLIRAAFENDKSKTTVYDFTELNLVQIARRRIGRSIGEFIEEDCEVCRGRGKRVKFSYLCVLMRNEIVRLNNSREVKDIHIRMPYSYEDDIKTDVSNFITSIGAMDKTVYLTFFNGETFRLEPLIFDSQLQGLQQFKIYG